jgi:hypothetical protein
LLPELWKIISSYCLSFACSIPKLKSLRIIDKFRVTPSGAIILSRPHSAKVGDRSIDLVDLTDRRNGFSKNPFLKVFADPIGWMEPRVLHESLSLTEEIEIDTDRHCLYYVDIAHGATEIMTIALPSHLFVPKPKTF